MSKPTFSVIIPLYNKEREIEGTIRSVLSQTRLPDEIVVVDDGSTDRSAEIVQRIDSPLIRLVAQPNAGECAARNRAIAEARGEYLALIDADDEWEPGFLAEIEAMIGEFPGCGLYCTGFSVVSHDGVFPARGLDRRGVVGNFFRDSAHRYIAIPSASCIPREVIDTVGGFPEGMKMAGDLYMWIKIARRYRVCYSPERLARYSKVASNRSATSYTPERTAYSFEELYDPAAPEEEREFIARAALGKALIQSVKGGTEEARRAARFFGWTRVYRRTLRKVRLLNRLPVRWRGPLLDLYNAAAWRLARKGL
ncbi:glycosyltransferase family A protein [uncultured Alistipes sp.]|uniref:glycosyltransferase family 2 protein n=1 Tax=uncultured Alistipes sp. TaxID=538949 RepID=UPI00261BCA4B|nr:glycosyltransferase family A protein [uncultured Alistipes sp.]